MVGSAITSRGRPEALAAVRSPNVHLADQGRSGTAARVARQPRGGEQCAYDLLARQQPVATDLRILVTSLRMSADLERMGDLARHVAKVARLRFPDAAVPAELRGTITAMSEVAVGMTAKVGSIVTDRDVTGALELERDDDEMDRLHRTLFAAVLDGGWAHGVEAAIDVTLIGRYYERFADHAVSIGRREVYLVTGERADELTAAP
ncbi:MAG: phosphate transport system regulatory protein PhoU [Actinomycetota bacterium]|nr:phosphate transport system regulatory protein PhoU [Actinomycetota bacterium]